MKVVVSVVNFIWSHGLDHRQCKSFLLVTDPEYGDVLYYTKVRGPNCWAMLKRLLVLNIEIKMFHEW